MLKLEFSGKFQGQNVTLKQISKSAAIKARKAGQRVLMCPANLYPLSTWGVCAEIDSSEQEYILEEIYWMVFYNCINKETGMYCRFYLVL